MFLVQSETFDPMLMDGRVEAFLAGFRSQLVEMSNEDFVANIESVCQNLLEKNKNLSEESSKYWTVITNQSYRFKRLQEIAAETKMLNKNDVVRFFDKHILMSPWRRKLSIQVFGKNHTELLETEMAAKDETVLIEDPKDFVRQSSLFPAQETGSIEEWLLHIL
jgi:insulysin